MKPRKKPIHRIIDAAGYSFAGFRFAWKNEAAFRQEIILCAILLPAACILGKTAVQIALLAGSCIIVLITELLNSAIEAVVDRIGHEHHELAGRAKDMGAAAVLCSLVLLLMTWGLIIFERC